MPPNRGHRTTCLLALAAALCAGLATAALAESQVQPTRATSLRLGRYGSIVSVNKTPRSVLEGVATKTGGSRENAAGAVAAGEPIVYPFHRPRLAGWSPLIAITTSDARQPIFDDTFEHQLQSGYVGNALAGDPTTDYIIGILDSGADVNLIAGSFAEQLGLTDSFLTSNLIPIGGVGESVDAIVTHPVGFFAAGFDAISANGTLDLSQTVGHSSVSGLAIPPIICGGQEAVTGLLGTAFIAFYNTVVNVDNPRTLVHNGLSFTGPTVRVQPFFEPLPDYPFGISLQLDSGGVTPTTAAYWPNLFDLEDQTTPWIPTRLALLPGFIPPGGWFFSTIDLLEGEPSPTNVARPFRMLVDTGAQSSIISFATAAALSLPGTPDFTVDVCGVGGLVPGVPGYYIDYVKINAIGGAFEFSRAPFVVIDLQSPDGSGVLPGILGMNFFWNRNITLEPSLTGTSFLTVSHPIPFAAGDFNLDLYVDGVDLVDLVACQTGPRLGLVGPDCEHVDIGQNGAIDLADVAAFQRCFSGDGDLADPACGG